MASRPDQERIVDCGGKPFQVLVGPDFKLTYRDIEKNKPARSLPKSAPKEVLAQLKNETALLKEVAKGQVARIENLMVRQHRWPADRWRAPLPRPSSSPPLRHPVGLGRA